MTAPRAATAIRGRSAGSTDRLIREALVGYGLPEEPRSFVELVVEALRQVMATPVVEDAAGQLTRADAKELRAIGLDPEAARGAAGPAAARSAATMTALLAGSLTVDETAERLHVTPGRIRQMLAERSLIGIRAGTGWRIPAYQLDGDRPVRNLRPVLQATPVSLHPIALLRWLTSPDPSLGIEGRPVSPREWLTAGGDPAPVAALAAEL